MYTDSLLFDSRDGTHPLNLSSESIQIKLIKTFDTNEVSKESSV